MSHVFKLGHGRGVKQAIAMLCAGILVGCTVGPNYKRPEMAAPARFAETQPSAEAEQLNHWWTTFNDPSLTDLIDRACKSNLDLQLAAQRVREARAQRTVTGGGQYPKLDASAGYTRQQISQSGIANQFGAGSGANAGGGGALAGQRQPFAFEHRFSSYQAGFDASWEIDIFGGVRRGVEAADADIDAAIEDHRAVLVTLLGDVARAYVQYRGFQRQLAVVQSNLKAAEESLDVTRAQFKGGQKTYLDVARAEAQLELVRAEWPGLEASRKQTLYQLGVLLGEEPAALAGALEASAPIPMATDVIPAGLPSDLLRRRPDVRRAERQLAGATARIGIATAELFPKFNLTGSLGQQSLDLKSFANGASTFWNFGPSVSWSLFSGGRVRANIEVQEARTQQAFLTYRKQVLTSLQEVETTLSAYQGERLRRQALAQAVEASRQAYDLALKQYNQGGVVDYLVVLDTQRSLFSAQEQLAQSDATVSANLVAVYKALGGGW